MREGEEMNVSNLELSKELHELSGWDDEDGYLGETPIYDLGFLLRKLHEIGNLLFSPQSDGSWYIFWDEVDKKHSFHADTPENAVASLACELFRQGILIKVGGENA